MEDGILQLWKGRMEADIPEALERPNGGWHTWSSGKAEWRLTYLKLWKGRMEADIPEALERQNKGWHTWSSGKAEWRMVFCSSGDRRIDWRSTFQGLGNQEDKGDSALYGLLGTGGLLRLA
jgi:hypothetical protein